MPTKYSLNLLLIFAVFITLSLTFISRVPSHFSILVKSILQVLAMSLVTSLKVHCNNFFLPSVRHIICLYYIFLYLIKSASKRPRSHIWKSFNFFLHSLACSSRL